MYVCMYMYMYMYMYICPSKNIYGPERLASRTHSWTGPLSPHPSCCWVPSDFDSHLFAGGRALPGLDSAPRCAGFANVLTLLTIRIRTRILQLQTLRSQL